LELLIRIWQLAGYGILGARTMNDLKPYHSAINQLKGIDQKLYARSFLRHRLGLINFKPLPNRNLTKAQARGIEQYINKLLENTTCYTSFSNTLSPAPGAENQ
jgi:hypothetical protein